MKKNADVVIIGGGIVGCAIASSVARKVKNVVLIEKNGISSQASGANFGMVWIQTRFPGFDVSMAKGTQELYEKLAAEDFDIDIEYRKFGGLTVGTSEAQLKAMKWQCKRKQSYGFPVTMLDREDTLRLEPNLSTDVVGSIFCGDDAQLNPYHTTMAFANLARRRGVEICDYTEVTGINVENNKIQSVITQKGVISTHIVVNAAGSWARNIAKMVNIDIPIFPQRLQALVTEPLQPLIRRVTQVAREISEEEALSNPEKATGFAFEYSGEQTEENLPTLPVEETVFTYFIPTLSGTIVIGTTNEFVGFNTRTSVKGIEAMLQNAARICPKLLRVNIIRTWANFVPFTYDGLPIIGKIEEVEGFIMAAGHAHAVSHAPMLAEQISGLIVDGKIDEMLEHVSIKRLRSTADKGVLL